MIMCRLLYQCFSDHQFLPHLEVLLTNQRAEEHHSLLNWCVQHLHSAQAGSQDMDVDGSHVPSQVDVEGSIEMTDAERDVKEKRDKALKRRAKLMSQISVMQKKFLTDHKEELDEIDSSELDTG